MTTFHHYKISETDIIINKNVSNISFTLNKVLCIGLNKIESDENNNRIIDNDTTYIALDDTFIDVLNNLYFKNNEIHFYKDSGFIKYSKITNKIISFIFLNPYIRKCQYENEINKTLIEFINESGILPYDFSNINNFSSANNITIEIRIHNSQNKLLYMSVIQISNPIENVSINENLDIHLQGNKKTETLKMKITNITNYYNFTVSNLVINYS